LYSAKYRNKTIFAAEGSVL